MSSGEKAAKSSLNFSGSGKVPVAKRTRSARTGAGSRSGRIAVARAPQGG